MARVKDPCVPSTHHSLTDGSSMLVFGSEIATAVVMGFGFCGWSDNDIACQGGFRKSPLHPTSSIPELDLSRTVALIGVSRGRIPSI